MTNALKKKIRFLLKDEIDMSLKRRSIKVFEALDPQEGEKILDAGCGPGFYLRILTEMGLNLKVYGVDVDRPAMAVAKESLKGKNVSISYGDLTNLKFADNSFDKVILSEVAEHVPDDKKCLQEMYRILKPGGLLVVTVPSKRYPFMWDPVNWLLERTSGKHIQEGVWGGIWTNHIRLYSPQEITQLLGKVKFKVEDYQSLTWWSLPFNHNLLYGGKFKPETSAAMREYIAKRPLSIDIIYRLVNLNDKINELIPLKNIGTAILVKARKP